MPSYSADASALRTSTYCGGMSATVRPARASPCSISFSACTLSSPESPGTMTATFWVGASEAKWRRHAESCA